MQTAAHALKLDVSDAALNDAFSGMAVGNYAGRAVLVNLRAGALASPKTAEAHRPHGGSQQW